ncbi:MAG TPA: hypothetical protein VM509_02755 [Planctomycetota bacterium]|nr:hypothetical protein [Planctomycetota bacterium]
MRKMNYELSNSRANRRGSVLVVALLVVMGVAGLGACLMQLSVSMTRTQRQCVDTKRAFYAAEAGLSEGIYGLVAGGSGNVASSSSPARFGDGVFWVKAVESADGRIRLESTALCGSGRASLAMVVEKKSDTTAALGIFSDGNLVVKGGSVIDSYDPNAEVQGGGLVGGLLGGVLGGAPSSSSAGRVGSNGNIQVQGKARSSTMIKGDVTPGPGGTVSSGAGVTITGSTAPRSAPIVLPAIEVPALSSLGDLKHKGTKALTLAAGEHRYGVMSVDKSAKLVIKGPQTLVVGSLVLEKGAQLVIDTEGGGVQIHVTEFLSFGKDTIVDNLGHDPALARFMISAHETVDRTGDGVPDAPVTINSKGQMYATLYAPEAQITLGNSLELFGAATAASLGLSEGAKLHFDEALIQDDGTGSHSIEMLSWRPLELPDVALVASRVDPLVALRLQGVALPKPYSAQQVVNFKIQFVDRAGETMIWAGDEAQFDWTQVQSVLRTTRIGDADFNGGLLGVLGGLVGGLLGGI